MRRPFTWVNQKPRKVHVSVLQCFAASVFAALLVLSSSARAAVPEDPIDASAAVAAGEPVAPRFAEPVLERSAPVERFAASHSQLTEFVRVHGDRWNVTWDVRSDRPHLIQGQGVPLLPGRGNSLRRRDLDLAAGETVSLDFVARRVHRFVDQWSGVLGIRGIDLRFDQERSGGGVGAAAHFWNVELQQYAGDVPVVGARVFVRISHGNAVQWGAIRISEVALDPVPRVTRERAMGVGRRALARALSTTRPEVAEQKRFETLDRGSLEILVVEPTGTSFQNTSFQDSVFAPNLPGLGYVHQLVWRFEVLAVDGHRYQFRVDAHSGEVVELADLTVFDDATVRAGVYVDDRTIAPLDVPLPLAAIDHIGDPVTDADGIYDYQSGDATLRLDGPHVAIQDTCGSIALTDSVTGNLDLGTAAGTDCSTPGFGGGGNTNAARTVFYGVNRLREEALEYFPTLPWLHETLLANTNIAGSCNAFWNGVSINFYDATPMDGCRNTGEVPEVIFHEWGHGVDENVGGTSFEKATGEAVGDALGFMMTRNACVGRGIRTSPCATCAGGCTGVRDVGAHAIGGTRTIARPDTIEDPDGVSCDRFECPFLSNGIFPYQGPMGYEGHCESLIMSSAVWDLAQALVVAYGEEAGWQAWKDIWIPSLLPSYAAYRRAAGPKCSPQAEIDGCGAENWFTVFLAIDDDDGNLANSTPNACHIYSALDAHGMACGDPLPCVSDCQPQPFPDAGENHQICLGETVEIGTPARPDHTYAWNPGGATSSLNNVAPSNTNTYEVTATTSCASYTDSVTVFVDNGAGFGLDAEFEDGDLADQAGWETTGLWHLVDGSQLVGPACTDPVATSGMRAMYFGRDATCDFNSGSRESGDLISPTVNGVGIDSTLGFDYFLQVESNPTPYDKLTVSIRPEGEDGWLTVWSRDSTQPSTSSWQNVSGLSLGQWADARLQVRFRFESVDGSFNRFIGAAIDNVVITESVSTCDYPPRVTIGSPADSSIFENGAAIAFSARAFDSEDGLITDSLQWHSDLDGVIGSGGEFSTALTLGVHQITASVTDSNGSLGSASLGLEIVGGTPTVMILTPSPDAELIAGEPATLSATAADSEDGDLSAVIEWTSSLDGALGVGAEIQPILSLGAHTLSASVTDSSGAMGSASVEIVAVPAADLPPNVALVAPVQGVVFALGAPISLQATASDLEDGDLTAVIEWSSDLEGVLGTGSPLVISSLQVGVHRLQAQVSDSGGQMSSASVDVAVTPDGSAPSVVELRSLAAEDGYLRESAAGSGVGGFANAGGGGTRALRLGDASGDRQYRSLVSFDLSPLDAGAQILEARLVLRRGRLIGDDPFASLGSCRVDLNAGGFGTGPALEIGDFEAPASLMAVAELSPASSDGLTSEARLDAAGRQAVADAVVSADRLQLRLTFTVPTDGDTDYDYLGYWSGEAAAADQPILLLTVISSP